MTVPIPADVVAQVEPGWLARAALTREGPARLASPEAAWVAPLGPLDEHCSIGTLGDRWYVVGRAESGRHGVWVVGSDGAIVEHLPEPEREPIVGMAVGDGDLWVATKESLSRWSVDGTVRWRVELGRGGAVEAAPALGDLDGDPELEAAVAGYSGVSWFDADGTLLGTSEVGREYGAQMPSPVIAARTVFVARGGGLVAAGGERSWSVTATQALTAPPLAADTDGDGRDEILVAGSHGIVLASDPVDGRVDWLVRVAHLPMPYGELWNEWFAGPAAWSAAEGCLLAATWEKALNDQALYCVAPEGPRWRHPLPTVGSRSGVTLGEVDGRRGDEAVLGTDSGEVWAVDRKGGLSWVWRTEGEIRCQPTVADLDGDGRNEVLVGTASGLVALSTSGRARRAP